MTAGAAPGPARIGGRRRREAAEDFRLMADSAPVMIWVADPQGQAVYFNRPWLDFTGRPLEHELGLGWIDAVHAEDRTRTLDAYLDRIRACEPFELEYRLKRKDGAARWLFARGRPLHRDGRLQGFVGSCLDITDRRAAEEQARQRERDFKTLAENIPDVIARLDRDLRCRYANRAVETAFGRGPDELIGRTLQQLMLPPNVQQPLAAAAERAFASRTDQRFEFQAQMHGERRYFAGRVIPENAGGALEGVLVIIYDVTAGAREEERRAEQLARERTARASAESATLARDHFLSIVSHDLRTPLNGIKTWAHFLDQQLRDAEPTIRRAIAGVMVGVDQQVRLIDDLLDLTRALSGRLALIKQPVALLPLVADAVEAHRDAARERGITLVTRYELADAEVHGDGERLRQVFCSLLANALKFTPPGGTVWIDAVTEQAMARVEVRDNGSGIPRDFLPFVFDPFRQADQGASRAVQQGLGLGLALVQRLAELHGGHVDCESEGVERGATFRVYLPLRHGSGARPAITPVHAAAASHLPSLDGIAVLLVDDQQEARESLAALLGQAGATVRSAPSGRAALEILGEKAPAEPVEVLVCDIAMPNEDGYATLKRIRQWEAAQGGQRVPRPAIAISAYSEREDRLRALREGFSTYLSKPISPAELMLVIANAARAARP